MASRGSDGAGDSFELSPIEERLVRAGEAIASDPAEAIAFLHTVLCQTSLPYRDPGDGTRDWIRTNGQVSLMIQAGAAHHPQRGMVRVGLPFGPKPRLMLGFLNAQALRLRQPEIEVEGSLTRFVRRLGLDTKGRNKALIRDQLTRLSAANIVLGVRSTTIKTTIVDKFDLWAIDDRQRMLWPSTVRLSDGYFASLMNHAVPLDERALAALSHSAMGLDTYAWLAQRLHRVPAGKDALVPWVLLHEQFGAGYGRLRKFREVFIATLKQVCTVYPDARLSHDERGLLLRHSRPPVGGRAVPVPVLPSSEDQSA